MRMNSKLTTEASRSPAAHDFRAPRQNALAVNGPKGGRCPKLAGLWLAAGLTALQALGQVTVPIGTLRPGQEVVITYEVTIASPLGPGVNQISNQGTVSGDFGSTNTDDPETLASADPTVTALNVNPVARTDTLVRGRNGAAKIRVADVLVNDMDEDGDSLTVSAVNSPTANNASLTLDGGWLLYESPLGFNGADAFTYTVSDGNGGTAAGTVNVSVAPDGTDPTQNVISATVSGTDVIVRFAGIPGRTYRIETSTLVPPITWTPHPAGPQVAGANGLFELVDQSPPSPRFYRAVEN